jgi:hypothetical protein
MIFIRASFIALLFVSFAAPASAIVVSPQDQPCPNPSQVRTESGMCVTPIDDSLRPGAADETVNTDDNSGPKGAIQNPLKADSLTKLLLAFVRGVVRIGAIALLIFLVYVGFQFVAAQGAEEKIRDARNALIWTVIGGAILLGAEAIMAVIEATANSLAP